MEYGSGEARMELPGYCSQTRRGRVFENGLMCWRRYRMIRNFGVMFLVTGLILAVGANYAQAGLAVDFANFMPDTTTNTGNWCLGWSFTVNQPVMVTGLGFFDDFQDDLTQSHDVAIYDAQQQIVIAGQVAPGDPLVSWWRWTDVAPTTLAPGIQYEIVAVVGSENYTWDPAGFVADPRVNYVVDAYYTPAGGVLAYPNASDGVVGFFGPNFSMDIIPAPGALALLVPGLMGLVGLRKRLS